MYLILERPDAPPRRIKIDGDVAVIGRAPHCDVVIDEEFVSKQHLRVMRGLVAVDLSTNGTYLDGSRIEGGVIAGSRPLQIGKSQITIRIEDDATSPAGSAVAPPSAPAAGIVPVPLPPLPKADAPRAEAPKSDAGDAGMNLLRRELKVLSGQLASRSEELARANADVERLRSENAALRERAPAPTPVPPPAAAVPEPQAAPADASASSMLLFRLQRENAQLKKALAEREAAPAAPAPMPSPIPAPAPMPAPRPIAASAPAFAMRTGGLTLQRLGELVKQDVEAMQVPADDPLDAWLAVEAFRFLRRVERVVTRIAGGLIQLYQLHTIVPGVEGNLRELLGGALASPDNPASRDDLRDYLKELGRWLVVAITAYRKAAEGFAQQLKNDLSAEALTASDPISMMKKMSGKSDAELWRRVVAHLHTLTPDRITELVEKLARDAATALDDKDAPPAFA